MESVTTDVIIIGAGPAGLTAGYILTKDKMPVVVLESDKHYVGGISRTVTYKNFCFDIGGHRFFSKSAEIEALWDEILGDDFLKRPRKSRIFYRGKFFPYPLKPIETFLKLGPIQSVLCVLSYVKARVFPYRDPKNFEEWVINKFGKRLFNIFFKTYTEKVWGMSCKDISADWAAQRIKGLSLWVAIKNAFFPNKKAEGTVKTLIDSFRYPRKGPGMMWQKAADKIVAGDGIIKMGERAESISYDKDSGRWRVISARSDGSKVEYTAAQVISSMPMRELVINLQPAVPEEIKKAAMQLKYRDFLIVALIVKDKNIFDDNWIYVHEPSVKVGRIQNFKSWSPEMVPDSNLNCYGLEYFCFEHDNIWDSADKDLMELAVKELCQLGLASKNDIVDGYIVRQPKAYPVYDDNYQKNVSVIREGLEKDYPGLHLVGRNGMHKYNNQDHAMMTAILAARNILAGKNIYNVWHVNQDAEYHETVENEETFDKYTGRAVPAKV